MDSAVAWWLRAYGGALLVMVAAAGLFVALGIFALRLLESPPVYEQGTVVRFGSYASDWGSRPVVIVRTDDGIVRQLHVDERETRLCKVGSVIQLVRRETVYFVSPQGCRAIASKGGQP